MIFPESSRRQYVPVALRASNRLTSCTRRMLLIVMAGFVLAAIYFFTRGEVRSAPRLSNSRASRNNVSDLR